MIELFQKNELELKDLKKISLTLESDYNYNQAVTKRNENDSDQVSNILKSLKAKNEETSQEISKKQNILKFYL